MPPAAVHGDRLTPDHHLRRRKARLAFTRMASRLALTAALLSSGSALAQANAASDNSAVGQLEDILVIARKRAEKLTDVPAAVTAFTEAQIEASGITAPRDFIAMTPNVTLVETQNVGTAFVVVRGIGQARNSEPSTAVVVDGVQQVNPSQFNQDLFDISGIEVLKGPQGGLYGRNAIGGAILITTKEPTDNYEFKVKAGVENGPGYTEQATASGAIVPGKLKFIGSISHTSNDGTIKNTYLDTEANPVKQTSGRLKLLFTPTEDLTVDTRFSMSELDTRGFYYNIVSDVNDTSLPVRVNNAGIDNRRLLDASVKVDWNLGFATATSVTAYDVVREIVTGDAFDFLPVNESFFKGLLGFDMNQSQFLDVKAVSEDFRLTSPNEGFLRWIVGGYLIHTDRYISTGNMVDTGNGVFPVYRSPSTNPLNPQATFLADSQDNMAWALYGDLTAELTDQLELALSLRYDSDNRRNTTLTPTAFLPNIPGFPQGVSGEVRERTFDRAQPKIVLRYKPDTTTTLYADWGRGFRSGGFNQTGVGAVAAANGILGVSDVFQAEWADTYELGFKKTLFDRRLEVEGAGFYTRSHNPYFFVFLAANSTQNLGNLGLVEYKGADAGLTAHLTDSLQASIGAGYTDSNITEATDRTVIGNQAPGVSKYTINAALQHTWDFGKSSSLVSRLEYQRIGDTYWDPQNSTVRDPVNLVDVRTTYTRDDWSVALWAKNVFDKRYNAEYSAGGFVFKALPRRFGAEATFWF
ncbi:TonB-dependent receptor [Nitrospirillum sp. BR 11164]|uniref:TonB-dependent receptor n=1 Tax=Nitrospirillum sp. BR 11164 TaxID=3104324 RepID=UPI002AFE8120|nr:TonB-dependent receptor [Nitrospirillum sp. BR 11164]MEA1652441.1 TonB-dependent receptor [Nitrospirillum sp. BR 11164]